MKISNMNSGIVMEWLKIDEAIEKAVFSSMQKILKSADDYISSIKSTWFKNIPNERFNRQNPSHKTSDIEGNKSSRNTSSQKPRTSSRNFGNASTNSVSSITADLSKLSVNDTESQETSRLTTTDLDYSGDWADDYEDTRLNKSTSEYSETAEPSKLDFYLNKEIDRLTRSPNLSSSKSNYNNSTGISTNTYGRSNYNRNSYDRKNDQRSRFNNRNRDMASQHSEYNSQRSFRSYNRNENTRNNSAYGNRDNQYSKNSDNYQSSQSSHNGPPSHLYKTRLCQTFESTGECPYGNKCIFAHSKKQLRPISKDFEVQYQSKSNESDFSNSPPGRNNDNGASHPPRYKQKLCSFYQTHGKCVDGDRCNYAHGVSELRSRNTYSIRNGFGDSQTQGKFTHQYSQNRSSDQSSSQGNTFVKEDESSQTVPALNESTESNIHYTTEASSTVLEDPVVFKDPNPPQTYEPQQIQSPYQSHIQPPPLYNNQFHSQNSHGPNNNMRIHHDNNTNPESNQFFYSHGQQPFSQNTSYIPIQHTYNPNRPHRQGIIDNNAQIPLASTAFTSDNMAPQVNPNFENQFSNNVARNLNYNSNLMPQNIVYSNDQISTMSSYAPQGAGETGIQTWNSFSNYSQPMSFQYRPEIKSQAHYSKDEIDFNATGVPTTNTTFPNAPNINHTVPGTVHNQKVIPPQPFRNSTLPVSSPPLHPLKKPTLFESEYSIISTFNKYFYGSEDGKVLIKRSINDELKEITRVEFKYNLSKRQLLIALLCSIFMPFEGKVPKSFAQDRVKLLKKISTLKDQPFIFQGLIALYHSKNRVNDTGSLPQSSESTGKKVWHSGLSNLLMIFYHEDLIEEEDFLRWYEANLKTNPDPALQSMKAFAEWLKNAEEE
ncbi:hypothetical protein BB560_001705 [Smittium megazygosporum]|uniref:C3H1-type domain-containing protein n=1 Tax=Smittium megazygosporum TaxID=133381 RepID=A0A2T9ZGT5_9FUNG|nr:hypothetical protein BB560_001705 [Smittium megazygosporum]